MRIDRKSRIFSADFLKIRLHMIIGKRSTYYIREKIKNRRKNEREREKEGTRDY